MPEHTEAEVVAAKKALRAGMIARRKAMTAEARQEGAKQLAHVGTAFVASLHPPPGTVSAFLAIGEEIDPAPLLDRLRGAGYETALPVMVAKGAPLVFRTWKPGEALAARMWGIQEPLDTAPEVEPDILLMPLLAFDRTGRRLGYGGGFFDRTLERLRTRKTVTAVGVAFACQEVDAVPHLDYDEPLDWVLTPQGPIQCRP